MRPASSQQRAFTMVEMVMSLGIITFFLTAVLATHLIATRNYYHVRDNDALAKQSRLAKKEITSLIQESDFVLEAVDSPATLTLLSCEWSQQDDSYTNHIASLVYVPDKQSLLKIKGTNVLVLLRDCEEVKFRLLQREYEEISTNTTTLELPELLPHTLNSCQAVELFWVCRKYWDEEHTRPSAEESGELLVRLRN